VIPLVLLRQVQVSRQVQADLDLGRVQQAIIFAACDIRQAGQISEDCSSAILPIQPCAAVRGLISPVQPGRTRKEVLESPCLPGAERRRETQHAWKAAVYVKTLMQSCRKSRTPRLKLDCGARPIARRANGRPADTTSDIGALLYC
jgi:hypothetical protein